MNFDVAWLGVLFAALAYMALGGVWFSPSVFGLRWAREIGKDPDSLGRNTAVFIIPTIGSLLSAYVLAVLMRSLQSGDVAASAVFGLVVGLAFVATALATNYGFMGKSLIHFLIDSGYHVAGFVIMAVIISLFQ